MLKNKSGGFTLLEITIVMAISASLATIILAGQNAVRAQAEFTGTVNSVASSLEAARNAVQTSDNTDTTLGTPSGTNVNAIVFAKVITANNGDNFITVQDVLGHVVIHSSDNQINQDCATVQEYLHVGQSYAIPLKWGITVKTDLTYPTSPVQIAYHRLLCGGQLMTYNLSGDPLITPLTTSIPQTEFSEALPTGQSGTILLEDPQGRKATITIDGANNGAVTRSFQ